MYCSGNIPTITYTTIGTKGQIVIPKEAREKLHIQPGDKVVLVIDEGRMMVINQEDVQSMINVLQEGLGGDQRENIKKVTKKKKSKKD